MQNSKSSSTSFDSANLENQSNLRRYQLLRYRDVLRLCDVMETVVPIHGTGNFPTLDIEPYRLVQLVRNRLQAIGVKVRDIRLNGSAATHVLSDDSKHTYKDLDLIFAIDFPTPVLTSVPLLTNEASQRDDEHQNDKNSSEEPSSFLPDNDDNPSPSRPSCLPIIIRSETPQPSAKEVLDDNVSLDDSGYTSSGSSGASIPASPCSYTPVVSMRSRKKNLRCRTRSLESMSSTSSMASARPPPDESTFLSSHYNRLNWQAIKDVAVDVLLEFLPPRVSRTNMNSVVLGNAYVEKMVKVSNLSDKWSLISLNNNSGRNLELKFVQSMKRQYEFSVDSFQIILDTYLAYKEALSQTDTAHITSQNFFPTVIAESVYGDFDAALRHLHHKRICTHKPEEIRGGGLLRYCNLLARNFTPGNVGSDDSPFKVSRLEQHMCSRFFIDFNDIERQQQKLISYLNSHFHGEEELKFQYLLILRRVVETSTICLMHHERTLILNLITTLARQSLAYNLANDSSDELEKIFVSQHSHYPVQQPYFVSNSRSRQVHFVGDSYFYPANSCRCLSSSSFTPNVTPKESPVQSRSPTPTIQSSKSSVSCNSTSNSSDSYSRKKNFVRPYSWVNCPSFVSGARFYSVSEPPLKSQDHATFIQPIYYDPSKMTCYYQPAR